MSAAAGTDVSATNLAQADGPYAGFGNNQMLAMDPRSGEVRRFLTGPRGCEITGIAATPDRRTFFVNIQHPGEEPLEKPGSAADPKSVWPDGSPGGPKVRPRSATIVLRRKDGGIVGT